MNSEFPFVSVVLPVRNEEAFIERCLTAVAAQDYPRTCMEILVVDGISQDETRRLACQTLTRAETYAWKIVDNPERYVSNALNRGIAAARGEVIVRVDAHTLLAPDYVTRCINALRATGADNVGGPMHAVGETALARIIALATGSRFGVGNARFHYAEEAGWVDTVYLGAYPRSVLERLGLFDTELVRNQDDEFNFRLTRSGGKIWLDPAIRSTYHSRATLRALAQQYYAYGYWKVRVIQKHGRPASLRHLVPIVFVAALLLTALLSAVMRSPVPLGVVLVPYLAVALATSFSIARATQWGYLLLLPLAFATMHLAYGWGFMMGLFHFGIEKRTQHE